MARGRRTATTVGERLPEVTGDGVQLVRGGPPSAADGLTVIPSPAALAGGGGSPPSRGDTGVPSQSASSRRRTRPPAASFAVRQGEAPWSEAELAAVERDLVTDHRRLLREVATLEAYLADATLHSADSAGDDHADTGSKAYGREQEWGFLTTGRATLLQTSHALRRIEDGSYGDCESCRQPIGKQRLEAFPRATQCVSCKQRQERR